MVGAYIARRTAQPLNGMLHRHQVRFLNRVLGERRPRHVLEVAPGPARLTAELDHTGSGIAIDGSAEMLAVARDRLRDGRGNGQPRSRPITAIPRWLPSISRGARPSP